MKKYLSVFLALIMSFTLLFSSVESVYAASSIFGLDISEHNYQGSDIYVDFDKLSQKNQKFLMIRIGYYNYIDDLFWEHVKKAYDKGINFGVYLYSYAFNEKEAAIEANFVVDTLSKLGSYSKYFTLPVAYDLEDAKILNAGCDKAQITKNMTTFCDIIKKAGYRPMVYANDNWFTNYIDINTAVKNDYKIWSAYYTDSPDFSTQRTVAKTGVKADIWQYTSKGKAFNCDENILYNPDDMIKPLTTCKHTYKNYVTAATTSKDGKIVKKCSVCGTVYSTTVINKASSVALSAYTYTYNAKSHAPNVIVKDSKGKVLKHKTDYIVTYPKTRVNTGRYTIKIQFIGNYSGTVYRYYNIVPKGTTIKSTAAYSKALRVQWNLQKTQTTGYQVQYSTSSSFKNAKTVTVAKNTNYAKKITGLSGNKRYYVRVRTYRTIKFGGKNYNLYSSWSGSKSIVTKR